MDREPIRVMIVGAGPGEERMLARVLAEVQARREARIILARVCERLLVAEEPHVFRIRDIVRALDGVHMIQCTGLENVLNEPDRRYTIVKNPPRKGQVNRHERRFRKQSR